MNERIEITSRPTRRSVVIKRLGTVAASIVLMLTFAPGAASAYEIPQPPPECTPWTDSMLHLLTFQTDRANAAEQLAMERQFRIVDLKAAVARRDRQIRHLRAELRAARAASH
jgi:hypothetical protein